MVAALASGFADPVLDSQAVFRAVLNALARPGVPIALPTAIEPPAPLTPELAALALTLADSDAPIWLDERLAADGAIARFLRFHTGAPIAEAPDDAAFALITAIEKLPPLDTFATGTDEYPDRSTTLVIAVDDLHAGVPLRLSGPGIPDSVTLHAALPADFPDRLRANHRAFPRGVDCLLVSRGEVVGLPRSASVA